MQPYMNTPRFIALLENFNRESLEKHHGPVVGLWPDYRMAYFNPAWFAFARDNDGEPGITRDWPLGHSFMDAVPMVLKPFYRQALSRCLTTCVPWHHDYECSSADVMRLFHGTAYPLGQAAGLLMVHSLTKEIPNGDDARQAMAFIVSQHVDRHGFVHQCANCRRVQNLDGSPDHWDWVPALVEVPYAQVSHTICPICLAFYHP